MRASRHAEVPLRDGLPVHLHLGTEDVVGRAAVLSASTIAPGETGFVQLDLDRPIVALTGDRAVLRDHAARTTLAGGRCRRPRSWRQGPRPDLLQSEHGAWVERMTQTIAAPPHETTAEATW
jgi:selenocysteine-specific translation elongation factor